MILKAILPGLYKLPVMQMQAKTQAQVIYVLTKIKKKKSTAPITTL